MVSFNHDWVNIKDGGNSSRYADDKWKGVFPSTFYHFFRPDLLILSPNYHGVGD